MSQQRSSPQVRGMRKSVPCGVILCEAWVRLHPERSVQCVPPALEGDAETEEGSQGGSRGQGCTAPSLWREAEGVGLFSLVERRARRDQTATHNYLKSSYEDEEAKLFWQWQTITEAKGHRLWLANFQMSIKEKNFV